MVRAAHWIDRHTVLWRIGCTAHPRYELSGNGHTVALHPGRLTEALWYRYPHLREYAAFRVSRGPVADMLRGEVAVTERDAHGGLLAVTVRRRGSSNAAIHDLKIGATASFFCR